MKGTIANLSFVHLKEEVKSTEVEDKFGMWEETLRESRQWEYDYVYFCLYRHSQPQNIDVKFNVYQYNKKIGGGHEKH